MYINHFPKYQSNEHTQKTATANVIKSARYPSSEFLLQTAASPYPTIANLFLPFSAVGTPQVPP